MADQKITELTENTTPLIIDLLALVDDPAGSPATQKIKIGNLFAALNAPRGFLINGKIVPSVASNNLTVAIKGMDGNDPSATNPVYCRIGDTIRSITSALSVTKNAGTNWFGSGSTGSATYERDYFVYLGYNATDGVVIGFCPLPHANIYSDFSTTTTYPKYCAISTITNAAAGDNYEIVGRFAATLSATAGFNWSVPTFTNSNLVQRPIRKTRHLFYLPTLTWTAGTAPANGVKKDFYWIDEDICYLRIADYSFTPGATVTGVTASLPFPIDTQYQFAYGRICVTDAVPPTPSYAYVRNPDVFITCTSVSASYLGITADYYY